jgi:type VI protein secretion system component Hcp
MRNLILILLFTPLVAFSQKTEMFVKLTDAKGQPIKGDAVMRGFERAIYATTLNSAGKNNTQLTFTMAISGAAADLKRAMVSGETLTEGQITVLAPVITTGVPQISYTVTMENIVVSSCGEVMDNSNAMVTAVTLQATRVGWTYYQVGKGSQTVTGKFGWDASARSEWSNF